MNAGYAGQFSREGDCVIEAKLVKASDTANINFGDVVVLNGDSTGGTFSQGAGFITGGGTFAMVNATTLAAVFAGFAARQVKSAETFPILNGATSSVLGYFAPGSEADVLVRGSIMANNFYAKSGNPAPVAGGAVWYRTSTNGAGTFVGALETANDAGHTVQLTNVYFTTGVVDSVNGTIEVTVTTRNIP
jgi:hypothetical protein